MTRDVPVELLREHVYEALKKQDPAVALAVARCLDAGQVRIMTRCDKDDTFTGESLVYLVELEPTPGRFVGLCAIHWSRLGLTEQDRDDELAVIRAEHGGIPDDCSSLVDP